MDFFFKSVTWAGSILVLLPIALMAAGILLSRGRQADALLIAGGLMGAFVLAHGLKRLFARPRPNIEDLLVAMPPDFSFPSAHTTQAAAFALACAMAFGRNLSPPAAAAVWIGLALMALLVGISRVYLSVHYVSDVVAGAVLGVAWVLALNHMLNRTVLRM